jgi:hypothetical protein
MLENAPLHPQKACWLKKSSNFMVKSARLVKGVAIRSMWDISKLKIKQEHTSVDLGKIIFPMNIKP